MSDYKEKKIIRGTLSLSISVIVTKIIGVLFKVPLSYVLGDDGMGYFNTAYAVYGFFYILCTAGVPKSVTLVISRYRAELKSNQFDEKVLKSGLKIFGFVGFAFTLILALFSPYIINIVGNTKALLPLIAVAPSLMFVSMNGVLRGYLNSNEKLGTIAVSEVLESILKLAVGLTLAWIGVHKNKSCEAISALAIFGISIGSVAGFICLLIGYKNNKKGNKKEQKFKIEPLVIEKQIVKNALPIAFSSSLLNLCVTVDLTMIIKRLVASGISEEGANAIYGNYTTLAVPMFNLVIAVLAPVAISYMPKLSELSMNGDHAEFSSLVQRLGFVTAFISVPACFSFFFYGFELLDVLFSVQSSAIGGELLACISLGLPFYTLLTVLNTALESKGKIGAAVFSLLAGSAIKYIVSYALIGRGEIGIFGAPIGTVISYATSLVISNFCLIFAGVRAHIARIITLHGFVGALCFYVPHKLIYSNSLFVSSFWSMIASLFISFVCYSFVILLFTYFDSKNVFNMHKNDTFVLEK